MAGRVRKFKLGGESKVFNLRGIAIGERGKRLMQLSADYARKYGARVRIVPIAKDSNLGGVPRYGAFVHLPPDYRMHNTRPVLNSEKNGRFRFPISKGGSEMLGPYLSDIVGDAVAKAERRAMHNQYPIHNPLPNLEIKNTVKNSYGDSPEFLMLNDTIEPPTKKRIGYSWTEDNYDYDSLDKEIGIRLYNAKKVPEISRIRRNIMGTTSFDLKGGKMRKSQDFIIYPKNSNDGYPPYIFQIQSKTRIGLVDMRNGRIIATPPVQSGAYGVHLAFYINEKAMQSLGTLEGDDYKALFDAIGASSQDWESDPSMIKTDNTGAGQEFFNSVKGREYERSMNPKLPKDGSLDGVLSRNPDPPAMNAGMPRDPDLLNRLKRMQDAKKSKRGKNPKISTRRLSNPKGNLLKGDYEVYFGNEKVGEIFRTGFGGEVEWTLKDFGGQDDGINNGIETTGHSTKKSAVETMRFLYGNRG
jgi:hypothetical protein